MTYACTSEAPENTTRHRSLQATSRQCKHIDTKRTNQPPPFLATKLQEPWERFRHTHTYKQVPNIVAAAVIKIVDLYLFGAFKERPISK